MTPFKSFPNIGQDRQVTSIDVCPLCIEHIFPKAVSCWLLKQSLWSQEGLRGPQRSHACPNSSPSLSDVGGLCLAHTQDICFSHFKPSTGKSWQSPPFSHNPRAPEAKCIDTEACIIQGWGPQTEGIMFDFYREQPQKKKATCHPCLGFWSLEHSSLRL